MPTTTRGSLLVSRVPFNMSEQHPRCDTVIAPAFVGEKPAGATYRAIVGTPEALFKATDIREVNENTFQVPDGNALMKSLEHFKASADKVFIVTEEGTAPSVYTHGISPLASVAYDATWHVDGVEVLPVDPFRGFETPAKASVSLARFRALRPKDKADLKELISLGVASCRVFLQCGFHEQRIDKPPPGWALQATSPWIEGIVGSYGVSTGNHDRDLKEELVESSAMRKLIADLTLLSLANMIHMDTKSEIIVRPKAVVSSWKSDDKLWALVKTSK